MKTITLERFGLGRDSTLGQLHIPGLDPVWTLEDERRAVKVYGETCIPEGTYRLELRRVGGFDEKYADRYPDIHRGMLWLRGVEGFEYILIHTGNHDGHTAGCILVGETPHMAVTGEFTVGSSRNAYRRIYPTIAAWIEAGEEVWIEVQTREVAA